VIIQNRTPFQAAWLEGKIQPPKSSATFVVKGCFDLKPGAPALPSALQAEFSGDVHVKDDPKNAMVYSTDLVPFKPRADVLVAGAAYAPRKGSADVLRVSVQVGAMSKMLAVIGDRVWRSGFFGNTMGPIQPFQRMEIGYDRSYGGAAYARNPLGRGHSEEAGPDGKPVIRLPNVEDPARLITSPSDKPEPAGFGPLPMMWPQRMSKVGTYKAKWLKERFPWFPEDFDWGFFNAAPADQQTAYLKGGERLKFENLHPDHPVLESQLPGLRIRCFYSRVAASPTEVEEVAMNLDTVWADPERLKVVLVWRGVHHLETPALGKNDVLFVASEPLASAPEPAAVYEAQLRASYPEQPPIATPEPAAPPAPAAAPPERPPVRPVSIPSGPTREELAGRAARRESFAGMDLTDADLSGLDLAGLDFSGAILVGASLRKATLTGANLSEAVLADADLSRADLSGATLAGADFTAARLVQANLERTVLDGALFAGAFLQQARLGGARGKGALFTAAKLRRADLRKAQLPEADFTEATLHHADLSESTLTAASLEGAFANPLKADGADWTQVKAAGAYFRTSSFRNLIAPKSVWQGARLFGADFAEANLADAEFSEADLTEAKLDLATLRKAKFIKAVLRRARGLRTDLMGANCQTADLSGAVILESNLFKADLINAVTDGAVFDRSNLGRTMLTLR
jgi:uncharacterized protein YjbI with pentapeptide repeats